MTRGKHQKPKVRYCRDIVFGKNIYCDDYYSGIQLIQHFYNSNLRFVCIYIFFISWKLYADDEFIIYSAERNNQLDLIARTTVDSEYSVISNYSTITNLALSTDQTLFNVKGGDTYLLSLNMTNRAEGYDFKWSYTWNFDFQERIIMMIMFTGSPIHRVLLSQWARDILVVLVMRENMQSIGPCP